MMKSFNNDEAIQSLSDNSTSTNDPAVSTNGWDTVYAVTYNGVNESIVAQKSFPENFSVSVEKEDWSPAIDFNGIFDPWQICKGGDGKNIHMEIPIKESKITITNDSKTDTYNFDKRITAKIELNLKWIIPDSTNQNKQDLIVSQEQEPVSVLSIVMGDNTTNGKDVSPFIKNLMGKWLNDHLSAFKHTFSVIDLNKQNAEAGFQWLMPTDTLYAVVDKEGDAGNNNDDGLDKSFFGVLCMTKENPSPGTHEISPFAIPSDCVAGFLIAPERVLENMIKPCLVTMFIGATDVDFTITENGLAITNNRDLECLDQQLENGKWISPKVDKEKFIIRLQGPIVEVEYTNLHFSYPIPTGIPLPKGWTPDMPGITVNVMYTGRYALTTTTDKKLKLDMKTITSSLNIHTATWLMVTEIVAAVVLSVVGGVAGGLIGKALTAPAKAAPAVIEGGAVAVVESIEVVASASGPSIATNIAADTITTAAADATTVLTQTGSRAGGQFATFFSGTGAKILGGMIGAGIGAGIASIPLIIKAIGNSQEGDDVNTIDKFSQKAVEPIEWPGHGPVELHGGKLEGALRLGFVPKKTT